MGSDGSVGQNILSPGSQEKAANKRTLNTELEPQCNSYFVSTPLPSEVDDLHPSPRCPHLSARRYGIHVPLSSRCPPLWAESAPPGSCRTACERRHWRARVTAHLPGQKSRAFPRSQKTCLPFPDTEEHSPLSSVDKLLNRCSAAPTVSGSRIGKIRCMRPHFKWDANHTVAIRLPFQTHQGLITTVKQQ